MVDFERVRLFCEYAVEECETLKSYEMVSTERELKDVIEKVREWPLMVWIIPSSEGDDISYDNVAERNTGMFMVLQPMQESMTREQRFDLWKTTQQGMKELKELIHDEICGDYKDIFGDMEFKGRSQEPEYNVADCSGWSLVVTFSTDWF
jgi:hypothetical protein